MKKISLFILMLGVFAISMAQTNNLKKKPTLGVNFFFKDFKTPDLIGHSSIGTVIQNGNWSTIGNMYPGLGIQYFDGISDYVDYTANLNGSFFNYPFFNGSTAGQVKFLLEATAGLNFKLLPDNYFMVPYLHTGVGVSMLGGNYFGAFIPAGGGFQFNLGGGNFLNLQWLYNLKVTDNTNYHFQYSLGFAAPLNAKKAVELAPPPPPPAPVEVEKDTDGDGIVDSKDKCPTVAGLAKYDGCPIPDTDGDGINDENDKCPTVKGIAKYNGCPIPDTDNDGINDEEDKCPTVAGVARYNGCPIPDTDNDGINDEEDKCPTEKGTAANSGCPELKDLNFNAKNVQFLTGSADLTKDATTELNKLVAILKEHNSLNISIDGYTDNKGKADKNKELSQKRAASVKAYLVKNGIADNRLTATGYGQENPIADNHTEKGRAENRRVEFKVKQ